MDLSVDPGTVSIQVGKGPQAATFKVTNSTNNPAAPTVGTILVPLTNLGVSVANKPGECSGQGNQYTCTIPALAPGASWAGVFQFGPPPQSNLQPGDSKSDNGLFQLSSSERQSYTIQLAGPAQDPVVPSVSGVVKDGANGHTLSQATVILRDSADHTYQTGSDSSGHFIFRSASGKSITPGTLSIGAARDGYQNKVTSVESSAGQDVSGVVLAMQATAAPTKSAAASAVPSAPGAINVGPSVVAEDTPADQEGTKPVSDGFPWMPVILGLLLVLLGGGGIAYLFYRRKEDGENGEDADAAAGAPVPGPRGRRSGGYQPANAAEETRVVPAYGGAPTMVGARGNESPTMLTPRSSLDEFADPYGAPPVVPRPPSYGNPPGYDDAPTTMAAPGFRGEGGYGGRPTSGGGYGPTSGGGYGSPRPTSGNGYGPTSGAGYGQTSAGGYGATSGAGYAGANGGGHGGRPTSGSGYGPTSGAGYGQTSAGGYGPTSGGGYGQTSGGYGDGGRRGHREPANGYGPTSGGGYGGGGRHGGGYDDQGYRGGDSGGYRGEGGYEGRGYESRGDDTRGYDPRGYDQDGGYAAGRTRRADRRSVDWLDD